MPCLSLQQRPDISVHAWPQPEAKASGHKALAKATECFQTGINRMQNNVYAAHGIGAVLAEQGHIQAAHTIFTQVPLLRCTICLALNKRACTCPAPGKAECFITD